VTLINRKHFMAELRNLLSFMDREDRERALRRYERMFDAAGPEGEEAVTRELGSPVRLVLKLEREYGRRRRPEKSPSPTPTRPLSRPPRPSSTPLLRKRNRRLHRSWRSLSCFPRRRPTPRRRMCIPPQARF